MVFRRRWCWGRSGVVDNDISIFDLENSDEEALVELIELEKENYFKLKTYFSIDSELAFELFELYPEPFLKQLVKLDRTEDFKNVFNFTDKEYKKIFIYYSLGNFIEISFLSLFVW